MPASFSKSPQWNTGKICLFLRPLPLLLISKINLWADRPPSSPLTKMSIEMPALQVASNKVMESPAFEQLHLELGPQWKSLFAPVASGWTPACLPTASSTCAMKICLNSLQPVRLHSQLTTKLPWLETWCLSTQISGYYKIHLSLHFCFLSSSCDK